jgi:hypothetical protein
MLTPLQLKSNYLSLLADSENITGVKPYGMSSYVYDNLTEKDSLTTKQWDNLVKVASIIEANANRFCMQDWHTENECGTAHCIAGWAESLAMNDTNYKDSNSASVIAEDMLSIYAEPFFWVTDDHLLRGTEVMFTFPGLPEEMVMKWFIKPILDEARRESYELSTKISQFIQKAKEETQVKELITS